MDEIAEFVDGHMDGRTITVTSPPPNVIRVPVPVNVTAAAFVNENVEDPEDRGTPIIGQKPSFAVEDYKRIGRNDAGRLRYSKL